MKQSVIPGGQIDALTPEEARALLEAHFREDVAQRVRAEGTKQMDNTGTGIIDVYSVPVGWEFDTRRINISTDAGYIWAKTVPLGGIAGGAGAIPIEYLRSGESIARAALDYVRTGGAQDEAWFLFPHNETWGQEQGPYIRNGENFQVAIRNLANLASVNVQVIVEGNLHRPPPK